jgi:hypothetical protein
MRVPGSKPARSCPARGFLGVNDPCPILLPDASHPVHVVVNSNKGIAAILGLVINSPVRKGRGMLLRQSAKQNPGWKSDRVSVVQRDVQKHLQPLLCTKHLLTKTVHYS